jgi:hypothetical protein
MKTLKLAIATILATTAIFGTVVKPAEARGGGYGYNWGGRANLDTDFDFQIFEDTASNSSVGFFSRAVENFSFFYSEQISDNEKRQYIPEFDRVCIGTFVTTQPRCSNNEPNTIRKILGNPLTLDLEARRSGNNIEFAFKSSELASIDISEIQLIIEDATGKGISADLNSLKSIVDTNLVSKVNFFNVLTTKGNSLKDYPGGEALGYRILDTTSKRIPPDGNPSTAKTPESSTTNSLLALGAVGLGLLLKRKSKSNLVES